MSKESIKNEFEGPIIAGIKEASDQVHMTIASNLLFACTRGIGSSYFREFTICHFALQNGLGQDWPEFTGFPTL